MGFSADYDSDDDRRYITGSQIVLIDPNKPESSELLTVDFISACSPDISWDASIMLFAGQKLENDPWQIWKMDLKTREFTRITQLNENCSDPVCLPTGRIIFSKPADIVTGDHSLFACNADGTEIKRLTFNPHTYFASSILHDGRIVSVSRQVLPVKQDPLMMVLRPDGTKAELFYKGKPGSVYTGKMRESDDGRLFFIEVDSTHKERVISLSYNRPVFSAHDCSEGIAGSFRSVSPAGGSRLFVSWRESDTEPYALYEFDADKKEIGGKIYSQAGMDVIDIIVVKENVRPKKLPSEVDLGVKTGLLLCQDINFSGLGLADENMLKSDKIEIVGMDSSMGILNVEKDGSFYLKVSADQAFRIRRLDKNGKTLNQSAWIWLRPNERRGCVGCHEHPELAPDNRVPLSVKKDPVIIPVKMSTIKEKEVELE